MAESHNWTRYRKQLAVAVGHPVVILLPPPLIHNTYTSGSGTLQKREWKGVVRVRGPGSLL